MSSHIDGGLRGTLRAEARDEAAANNLRDVVRGFMALAKMQTASKPELQAMLQSLELGGTGKTVSLSFVGAGGGVRHARRARRTATRRARPLKPSAFVSGRRVKRLA